MTGMSEDDEVEEDFDDLDESWEEDFDDENE